MHRLFFQLPLQLALFFWIGTAGCTPQSPSLPDGVLPIGHVQGVEDQSPLLGEVVTVQGVLTGLFEGRAGFFLQAAPGEEDGDPRTSDGIFLQIPEAGATALARGDRVRVTGTVVELGSPGAPTLTAIEAHTLEAIAPEPGSALLPVPVRIETPPASPAEWERYEGMLVEVVAPLTVTGQFGLRRFGELQVSFDARLYQPTELHAPGPAADSARLANEARLLTLDDGTDRLWPEELGWMEGPGGGWPSDDAPLRAGSVLAPITGIIDVRRGSYLLLPVEPVQVVSQAVRPDPPIRVDLPTALRVAVLNVENLFNGDGMGGEFPTPRGAETPEAYALQQAKLVATLQALHAHVAALSEMENDGVGPRTAVRQFVDALNTAGPSTDWRALEMVGPGTDAIRNAIVYRASQVRPVGDPVVPSDAIFEWGSRPPLGQAFIRIDDTGTDVGEPWLVVANHLKSKGGCPDENHPRARPGDADQGDGQSCWNAMRSEAARALGGWLAGDPARLGVSGDPEGWTRALIVGDLNSYAREDPLRILEEAGWVDAFGVPQHAEDAQGGALAAGPLHRAGPPYSYVFRGQAGRLDHALLHYTRASALLQVAKWHTNADEDPHFGYEAALARAQQEGATPVATVWRSSDHDPVVVTVRTSEDQRVEDRREETLP